MQESMKFYQIAKNAIDTDKSIADTRIRLGEKGTAFQSFYLRDSTIVPTIRSKPDLIDIEAMSFASPETIRNSQTFPEDYQFPAFNRKNVGYICGMSVPPVMMKRIVKRLIEQGVFDYAKPM